MTSKWILEAIWREFWEQPDVPVFPGDFESFVRCKEIFCRVAAARLLRVWIGTVPEVAYDVGPGPGREETDGG